LIEAGALQRNSSAGKRPFEGSYGKTQRAREKVIHVVIIVKTGRNVGKKTKKTDRNAGNLLSLPS
jgi:hypothetical protein